MTVQHDVKAQSESCIDRICYLVEKVTPYGHARESSPPLNRNPQISVAHIPPSLQKRSNVFRTGVSGIILIHSRADQRVRVGAGAGLGTKAGTCLLKCRAQIDSHAHMLQSFLG